jgi:hypothetical protein
MTRRNIFVARFGIGLEYREYGCRDPSFWLRGTLFPQKLALTLLTRGGRSVDIVRWRTEAMKFVFYLHRSEFVCKAHFLLASHNLIA